MSDTEAVFSILAIGRVACPRTEPIDDDWGEVVSRVILDAERFTEESLQGLGEFSHVDVVYVFDQVDPDSCEVGPADRVATPSGRRLECLRSGTSVVRTASVSSRASCSRCSV